MNNFVEVLAGVAAVVAVAVVGINVLPDAVSGTGERRAIAIGIASHQAPAQARARSRPSRVSPSARSRREPT